MLTKLILFVEELSMEAALQGLLPQIPGMVEVQIIKFQCKQDLLSNLPARLQGYRSWLPDEHVIVVLVDRDSDDCKDLKLRLEDMADKAGLITKTMREGNNRFQVVNRIVIEELESWFFGDWKAVKKAYPRVPENVPRRTKFRDPDAIEGGTWEALEWVMKDAGYFSKGLRKLEFAREVGKHMSPDPKNNKSKSFKVFLEGVNAAIHR